MVQCRVEQFSALIVNPDGKNIWEAEVVGDFSNNVEAELHGIGKENIISKL